MPGDDARCGVQTGVQVTDHPRQVLDIAAVVTVDKGEHAVEEQVAEVDDVVLLEIHDHIPIGMASWDVHGANAGAIHRHCVGIGEGDVGPADLRQARAELGTRLQAVSDRLVRDDPGRVRQQGVAADVIVVEVGVDDDVDHADTEGP